MDIKCLILSDGALKTINSKNRWESVGSEEEITGDLITTNGFLYSDLTKSLNKKYLEYILTETLEDGSNIYESEMITKDMQPISLAEFTDNEGEQLLEVTVPSFTIKDNVKPTDFILSYSDDEGFKPIVESVKFATKTTHKESVSFKFSTVYNYNTKLKFRVKINAGNFSDWSSLQDPYKEFNGIIPVSTLNVGDNTVTIEVTNESENLTVQHIEESVITLENGSPSVAVFNNNTDNFKIHFQIIDPDADKIRYRLLLNNSKHKDLVLSDWSQFIPSEQSILYYIDTTNVVVNKQNVLKIEYEDEYKSSGSYTHVFTGMYKNLVFIDEDGEYFTTDKGVLLKILDFKTILSGDQTEVREVTIQNNNNTPINHLKLSIHYANNVNGVEALISKNNNPFKGQRNIDYGDEVIGVNDSKKFYVRMDSEINAEGLCKFDIDANADVFAE